MIQVKHLAQSKRSISIHRGSGRCRCADDHWWWRSGETTLHRRSLKLTPSVSAVSTTPATRGCSDKVPTSRTDSKLIYLNSAKHQTYRVKNSPKTQECVGIYLTKEMQDLTLKKTKYVEKSEDLKTWKDILCSRIRRLIIVKAAIFHQTDAQIRCNSYQNPSSRLPAEIDKHILKCIWKQEREDLEREEQSCRTHTSQFQNSLY